jgi:hypothetical protein
MIMPQSTLGIPVLFAQLLDRKNDLLCSLSCDKFKVTQEVQGYHSA